ncbi:MAG: META domain-containing protein [Chromatiales bacterium]|nr:META domain-containing protein [Chromatiales bacterium]
MMRRNARTVVATALALTITAHAAELDGTSWQLVKITSMDDRVFDPDDPARYTLTLDADGTARMLADCNRGFGPWTSASAEQLQFGPVTSTRALCPQASLSEKYLAQFEWVRSYVLTDGHLFLATMADGAIIEFSPLGVPAPAATVLGEALDSAAAEEIQATILARLFDRYAMEQGLDAQPLEIDTLVADIQRDMTEKGMTAGADLTPDEPAEVDVMRRNMAQALIRQWKINRSLYGRYGGRIIYQQFGPEPIDAFRRFLMEREANGAFAINDPAVAARFWEYFTDDSKHEIVPAGSPDDADAFSVPPWRQLGSRPKNPGFHQRRRSSYAAGVNEFVVELLELGFVLRLFVRKKLEHPAQLV